MFSRKVPSLKVVLWSLGFPQAIEQLRSPKNVINQFINKSCRHLVDCCVMDISVFNINYFPNFALVVLVVAYIPALELRGLK
jgi:hypothetical protein